MMKLPPTVLIQETNFHNSWARAVRYVIRDGVPLVIGDVTEPKSARDICATIELTGNAIQQIEDRELHPLFPFRHIDQYCEELTREYLSQYIKKQGHERFSYLYFERLAHQYYFPLLHYIDQVEEMCGGLAGQIDTGSNSNRNQSITWNFGSDLNSTSPPCLQRIWIRYLGDQSVEVHLTWRSRDLFTAWRRK